MALLIKSYVLFKRLWYYTGKVCASISLKQLFTFNGHTVLNNAVYITYTELHQITESP